jgi:adhesin HecA-like repeat protein
MEPMTDQIAALEKTMQALTERQGRLERQLGRWRGLAVLMLLAVLFQPLRTGTAAAGEGLVRLARGTPYQPFSFYRPPRVRRSAPAGSGTAARLTMLERAVNYEEQQIEALGAALNQEIAARQLGGTRFQALPEAARPAPLVSSAAAPFTGAQTVTLRKLAGLLVVSGGVIRCNGDLALTSGHALLANRVGPVDADARLDERGTVELSGTARCYGDVVLTAEHRLLANKIVPIDAEGRPDDHGTTEFSGNVSIARRLSSPGTAKPQPSPP